jgi:hypothetical protein
VCQKNLGQEVERDHQRRHVGIGAGTDIKQKFLAVANLHKPAGGCLAPARGRHAGAQRDKTNLFLSKLLGAGVVHITIRRNTGWRLDISAGSLGLCGQFETAACLTVVQSPQVESRADKCHRQGAGNKLHSTTHKVAPF